MVLDPLSPRNLASVLAFGGLATMMIAPEPNWHSVGVGLACLLAFAGLRLVPVRKPARRRLIAGRPPRRAARDVDILPAHIVLPAHGAPPLALPAPSDHGDPHPGLFRGTRARRGGRSN